MNRRATSAFAQRPSWAVLSGIAAVVGLLVGAAVVALERRGGGESLSVSTDGERAAYYSATDLLSRSSSIVIATYLDSSTREVNVVSRGTGLLTGDTRTDVYQRYEVVGTLKGSISPVEVQEVVGTSARYSPANDRRPAYERKSEVLSPVKGQLYVLFLRSAPVYPNEPDVWIFAGEPRMAIPGKDGTLHFLLTKGFEEELRAEGRIPPGASAPFTATLDEIRAEIARQAAAPPPTPATPAPEPTPAKTVPANP